MAQYPGGRGKESNAPLAVPYLHRAHGFRLRRRLHPRCARHLARYFHRVRFQCKSERSVPVPLLLSDFSCVEIFSSICPFFCLLLVFAVTFCASISLPYPSVIASVLSSSCLSSFCELHFIIRFSYPCNIFEPSSNTKLFPCTMLFPYFQLWPSSSIFYSSTTGVRDLCNEEHLHPGQPRHLRLALPQAGGGSRARVCGRQDVRGILSLRSQHRSVALCGKLPFTF